MGWRRWAVATAAAMVASGLAVGIGSAGNGPAQLLEGHTVFVAISNITGVEGHEGPAAAVAVLVREHNIPLVGRFPGVLWYNDQYLVDPSSVASDERTRYPCTGAVIAVERGRPDPRDNGALKASARYVESYHVTDPNDVGWDVHLWNLSHVDSSTYPAWSVAIRNTHATSNVPDDGGPSCDPVVDRGCPLPIDETACYQDPDPTAPDASLERLDCLPPSCGTLRYNALLFFWLKDIENAGPPKNHSAGGQDVPGCHEDDPEFGCPGGDDDAEGNSHRVFDPLKPAPVEPGSADCDGNTTRPYDAHCHRTASIDVYYGTAPTPEDPEYVLYDDDGSTEAITCGGLPEWLGSCLP